MAMRRQPTSGGLATLRPAILGLGRAMTLGLSAVAGAPLSSLSKSQEEEPVDNTPVWFLYVTSMALVLLGGAFAGLTIAWVASSAFSSSSSNVHADWNSTQIDGTGQHISPSRIRRSYRTTAQERRAGVSTVKKGKALGAGYAATFKRHCQRVTSRGA